jgi:hypothetical protein
MGVLPNKESKNECDTASMSSGEGYQRCDQSSFAVPVTNVIAACNNSRSVSPMWYHVFI